MYRQACMRQANIHLLYPCVSYPYRLRPNEEWFRIRRHRQGLQQTRHLRYKDMNCRQGQQSFQACQEELIYKVHLQL